MARRRNDDPGWPVAYPGHVLCCGRHAPVQTGEARIVPVHRNPLTAPFDRERRIPGVRDAWPANIGLDAELTEDAPVSLTGFDDLAIRLAP